MAGKPICSIEGCIKIAEKRGWCGAHYARWRRNGSPLGGTTENGAPQRWLKEALSTQSDDCLIWPFSTSGNGYPKIGGGKNTRLVHRLVCIEVNGNPDSGQIEAAHYCGNRLCCNGRHLRWATHAENMADKIVHGTENRSLKNGMGKLSDEQVMRVESMKGLASQAAIGREFGITQSHVSLIQLRKVRPWLWK